LVEDVGKFRKRTNAPNLRVLKWEKQKGSAGAGGSADDSAQARALKEVEGHLQKRREIDVKKVPLKPDHKVIRQDKRYQKVRVVTHNAAKAAWLVGVDKGHRGDLNEDRLKRRAYSAAGARKQLMTKKLKTKIDILDAPGKHASEGEGDGEEGEEGAAEPAEAAKEEKPEDGAPAAPDTPPELTCTICWMLYLDAQELPCGHHYCNECILDTWQVTAKMACPMCSQPVWKRQLKPLPALNDKVLTYKNDHPQAL